MKEKDEIITSQPNQASVKTLTSEHKTTTVQNDDTEHLSLIEKETSNLYQNVNQSVKKPVYFIWVLLFSGVIMYSLYGNIATFYPPYASEFHV